MTEETTPPMVCYRHPDRETLLTCNRCGRPICTECAVRTPTGYRCPECIRGQQQVFNTATPKDYLFTIFIAFSMGAGASFLVDLIPFFGFFIILIGPVVGTSISRAVQWAAQRHRSKLLHQLATGAAVLGSLLPHLSLLLSALFFGGGFGYLATFIWKGIYIFLAASTMYYQLRGIQIR